jgi:formiminotetrahydrofolate cyclodeaminase
VKKYKSHTLKEYSDVLSMRTPTPGGGSAAAYTAALGVALLSMVANYSLGKSSKAVDNQMKKFLKTNEKFRKRLLELVDLDAQAYLNVVKSRKSALSVRRKARKKAAQVPFEVSRICYEAVKQAPFLVAKGNKYLLSDVEVGVELLEAAFRSAMINVRINQ